MEKQLQGTPTIGTSDASSMVSKMTHGGLFEGIGGFAEGARRAGVETLFSVEINPYRREVLKKNEPNGSTYQDIRTFKGDDWKGIVDILSGGFPCQDISAAGGGAGIRGSRSILWHEYARLIWEIRPRYAIIENSPRLLQKGFEKVLWDLSKIGYDAQWDCISAAAFGMPHQRERLFVIAYPHENGFQSLQTNKKAGRQIFLRVEAVYPSLDVFRNPFDYFAKRMGQSAVLGVDDGFPGRLHCIDRLQAVGDSVSPVITEYLFNCIKMHAI